MKITCFGIFMCIWCYNSYNVVTLDSWSTDEPAFGNPTQELVCDAACIDCVGEGPSNCTTCAAFYYQQPLDREEEASVDVSTAPPSAFKCVTQCDIGWFGDIASGSCKRCIVESCALCTYNGTVCMACVPDKSLRDGDCHTLSTILLILIVLVSIFGFILLVFLIYLVVYLVRQYGCPSSDARCNCCSTYGYGSRESSVIGSPPPNKDEIFKAETGKAKVPRYIKDQSKKGSEGVNLEALYQGQPSRDLNTVEEGRGEDDQNTEIYQNCESDEEGILPVHLQSQPGLAVPENSDNIPYQNLHYHSKETQPAYETPEETHNGSQYSEETHNGSEDTDEVYGNQDTTNTYDASQDPDETYEPMEIVSNEDLADEDYENIKNLQGIQPRRQAQSKIVKPIQQENVRGIQPRRQTQTQEENKRNKQKGLTRKMMSQSQRPTMQSDNNPSAYLSMNDIKISDEDPTENYENFEVGQGILPRLSEPNEPNKMSDEYPTEDYQNHEFVQGILPRLSEPNEPNKISDEDPTENYQNHEFVQGILPRLSEPNEPNKISDEDPTENYQNHEFVQGILPRKQNPPQVLTEDRKETILSEFQKKFNQLTKKADGVNETPIDSSPDTASQGDLEEPLYVNASEVTAIMPGAGQGRNRDSINLELTEGDSKS